MEVFAVAFLWVRASGRQRASPALAVPTRHSQALLNGHISTEISFLLSSKITVKPRERPRGLLLLASQSPEEFRLLPCSAAAVHALHLALASLAAAGASRAEPQELGEGFPLWIPGCRDWNLSS